jgi:hypothetical protein
MDWQWISFYNDTQCHLTHWLLYICPTANPQCHTMFTAPICSTQTAVTPCTISVSEATCCPLSLWCLQCCWWHSAGCRTYWVSLQHRATVVTSNGVTVCAASFHLPLVSAANTNTVQHPTPHQQYETPTTPAVVISNMLLPQSNIMAAFVHSHYNLLSDVSPGLSTFNKYHAQNQQWYSLRSFGMYDMIRYHTVWCDTRYDVSVNCHWFDTRWQYSTVQYNTVKYSTVQYNTIEYSIYNRV